MSSRHETQGVWSSLHSPLSKEGKRSPGASAIRFRRIFYAAAVLLLAQFVSIGGAHADPTHRIVAVSSTAAPAGGNYSNFTTLATNVRGELAFDASLGGPSFYGVFLANGNATSAIALGGDPSADAFGFVSTPTIDTRGDVVFDTESAIVRADGRNTVRLVQNGDAAPGGGSVTLGGAHVANSHGDIAFAAFVDGSVSTQGIFRNDGAHTVAMALDSTPPPTGGAFLFFGSPVIADGGEVAFFAGMTGGSADFGIFRSDGKTTATIFAANAPAPGGGTFVDFSDPLINKHGQVLALALLANGAGPSGLFRDDGKEAVAIALAGHAAPKGGNYATFFGPLSLNDRGQSAFGVTLTGGSSTSGIFRGDGAATATIALRGTPAAGTTGTFDSFKDVRMGPDGRVAFTATLTVGVGGVDFSNNSGIWVGTSDQDLRLVARSGDVIAGRTLTRPLGLAQLQGDDKPLAWLGRFSGPATAIVATALDGTAK